MIPEYKVWLFDFAGEIKGGRFSRREEPWQNLYAKAQMGDASKVLGFFSNSANIKNFAAAGYGIGCSLFFYLSSNSFAVLIKSVSLVILPKTHTDTL